MFQKEIPVRLWIQKGFFMEIGKKIRELRMRKGLTQEELANRSELSKGFISQLENDVTSPSIATLVDVLTCLGTDLKTFFGESRITRSSSVRKITL